MRKTLYLAAIFISSLLFSQGKIIYGAPFSFNVKAEQDAKFALQDGQTSYLSSAALSEETFYQKFFVRQLDASNNLTGEFVQPFGKSDDRALCWYLGSFSGSGAGTITFLNESSSSKSKKMEIYKTVFNKNSETFTSSIIASYPFESQMKSGGSSFTLSDNGRYAAVVYHSYQGRKDPKKAGITVLDTNSSEVVWQKELIFNDEFSSRYIAVSNTGNVVITRDPFNYKEGSKLHIVSKDSEEEVMMEPNVLLFQPYLFTKGSDEYLFAFDSPTRNSKDYFDSFMMYDLNSKTVISNTKMPEYTKYKKPENVLIEKIFYQNDEFQIFAEAKYQNGTKPAGAGFTEPVFSYGKGLLFSLDNSGMLKNKKNIGGSSYAPGIDLYRAYGVQNVMGNYYINSGYTTSLTQINPRDFSSESVFINKDTAEVSGKPSSQIDLNQVFSYEPKTKQFYFVQIKDETAEVVSASGYEKEEKKKK